MKLAVISDLHLGPGGKADGFGHDDHSFLRFLDHLESNFERIILLGDIWETLTARWPSQVRDEIRRCREAHLAIAHRFERPRYSFVHGNHDWVLAGNAGVHETLRIDASGARLLFTHGHQHDVLLQYARWVSELGVWAGGWIRRLGGAALYKVINRIDAWRGQSQALNGSTFERWAVDFARRRSADVIVTGHTHRAAHTLHANTLFMNSGTCCAGKFSYLAIDTKQGQFGVHNTW